METASLGEWLDMGGYASYVWPVYGIALAVLVGVLVHGLRALRGEQTALDGLRRDLPSERESNGEA